MIQHNFKLAFLLVLSLSIRLEQALACSTVTSPNDSFIGKNFDWTDQHVMFVAQPEGARRSNLNQSRRAHWDVKFANTTVTQFGPGLPYEGLNSEGLAIQILWLNSSSYEPHEELDRRVLLNELEWIQYHLDNYGSLEEIFADMEELPASVETSQMNPKKYRQIKVFLAPAFAEVHFFVCDRTNACATFEWLNSTLVVHRLDNPEEVQVLTNSTYDESLQDYRQSLNTRFTRLGNTRLRQDRWSANQMFDLLDVASQPSTIWQSVYVRSEGEMVVKHKARQATVATNVSLARAVDRCKLPLMQWIAYDREDGTWLQDETLTAYSADKHLAVLKAGLNGLGIESQFPPAETLKSLRDTYLCDD